MLPMEIKHGPPPNMETQVFPQSSLFFVFNINFLKRSHIQWKDLFERILVRLLIPRYWSFFFQWTLPQAFVFCHNTCIAISGEGTRYSMIPNKDRSSVLQEERVEPCHLSSSLYYGGQDVYSQSPSAQTSASYPIVSLYLLMMIKKENPW